MMVDDLYPFVQRLYVDPLMKTIARLIPRWRMQLKRRIGTRHRMTREEKAKSVFTH